MSTRTVIDADGLILGRMASVIAKRLLAGETIELVNAQNVVISGNKGKLVEEWKVALPLHSEFGTKPNVFYIPPLSPPRLNNEGDIDATQPRLPVEYLRSLFGPEVDGVLSRLKGEIEKKRKKEESKIMDVLIAPRWQELLGPFVKDPSEAR